GDRLLIAAMAPDPVLLAGDARIALAPDARMLAAAIAVRGDRVLIAWRDGDDGLRASVVDLASAQVQTRVEPGVARGAVLAAYAADRWAAASTGRDALVMEGSDTYATRRERGELLALWARESEIVSLIRSADRTGL